MANYEDKAQKKDGPQPFSQVSVNESVPYEDYRIDEGVIHWKALKVCGRTKSVAHKFVVGRCFYYGACYRLTITLLHTDTRASAVRYMRMAGIVG